MKPTLKADYDLAYLDSHIGVYNDWPKDGVVFRDIAPLFADPKALQLMTDGFLQYLEHHEYDCIACIDARGFLIASIVAYEQKKPLVLVRKKGKLPGATLSQSYDLEYGSQQLEMQQGSCRTGDRVVLFDDLIATGGSLGAAVDLVHKQGAEVICALAIIDLFGLGGSEKIRKYGIDVFTLLAY